MYRCQLAKPVAAATYNSLRPYWQWRPVTVYTDEDFVVAATASLATFGMSSLQTDASWLPLIGSDTRRVRLAGHWHNFSNWHEPTERPTSQLALPFQLRSNLRGEAEAKREVALHFFRAEIEHVLSCCRGKAHHCPVVRR